MLAVMEPTRQIKLQVPSETHKPCPMPPFIAEDLFNHASEGFVLMDSNREILWMNPAAVQLTGFTAGCGIHCGALFNCHGDSHRLLGEHGCYGNHTLLTRKPVNAEMNIVTQFGETVTVAVGYSYIPADDSREYLLMSIRDISDRKKLETELRKKEALHYTLQERERLARDLHDGVVQDIAYANMQMKLLLEDVAKGNDIDSELLARLSQVLDESYLEMRQALFDLTFRVKEDLPTYIRTYLSEYEKRTGLVTHFSTLGKVTPIDADIASQVAKMLQEALANIRKHARARHVDVTLAYQPGGQNVQLRVQDDGTGFDLQQPSLTGHYGLKSMQERCTLLGGELAIDSILGKGTTVYVEVPMTSD